jgi:hypothetical protein
MGGPQRAPLAPNKTNELRVPATRLPLGGWAEARAGDALFEVWIPTKHGGDLSAQHWEGGTVQIIDGDKPISAPGRTTTARVAPGKARAVLVKATGGPSSRVNCTFSQTAFARQGPDEKKDKVLIPYNFWFWPTVRAKSTYADQALDVLKRYVKATRGAGSVKDATDWEHDQHGRDSGPAWQGHCHAAAPASALFEVPTDITINGESFTLDEMKYLGAEFFGNFGAYEVLPTIKMTPFVTIGTTGVDVLECLKPEGPHDVGQLALAFMTFNSSADSSLALSYTQRWLSLYGSSDPAQFEAQMRVSFGIAAAFLFSHLMEYVYHRKEPLFGNMRAYQHGGGPEQVWNQALFHYEATLEENPDTQDRYDIVAKLKLTTNLDHEPVESRSLAERAADLPATATPDQLNWTVEPSRARTFEHAYRLLFDDDGNIRPSDARNEWRRCRGAGPVYAPTRLARLMPPSAIRRTSSDPDELGNPFVGRELIDRGYLRLNARYAKGRK